VIFTIISEITILLVILLILSSTGYSFLKTFRLTILNNVIGYTATGICLLSALTALSFISSFPIAIVFFAVIGCLVYAFAHKEYWTKLLSIETLLLIVAYFSYKFIYFRGDSFSFYFHRNPDPYGSVCVYGYMNKIFSYKAMLQEFYTYTGLLEPRWVKPPLLKDVWSIPDAQLRFAADQIIGSGRIGIASLLLLFKRFLPNSPGFFKLFFEFSLICLWTLAGIVFTHSKILISHFKTGELKLLDERLFKIFTFVFVIFMPLFKIEFMEGCVPQIYSKLIIMLLLLIFANILFLPKEKHDRYNFIIRNSSINLIVILLSAYWTYPDALLLILGIVSFFSITSVILYLISLMQGNAQSAKQFFGFFIPLIVIFLVGTSIVLLDSRLFWQLKSRLLSFNSGGALHLGIPSIITLLGFGKRLCFSNFGSGFYPTTAEIFPNILSITIFFSIIVSVIFIMASRRPHNSIKEFLVELVPVFFCFAATLSVLIGLLLGKPTNDYIYFRSVGVCIIVALPSIILLLFLCLFYKRIPSFLRLLLLFFLCLFAIFQFSASSGLFKDVSQKGYFKKPPSSIDFSKTLFVSDVPHEELFALAEYGPFYYLTDDWQPFVKHSGKVWDIYEVRISKEDAAFYKLGAYIVDNVIAVPCNVDCMRNLMKQCRSF